MREHRSRVRFVRRWLADQGQTGSGARLTQRLDRVLAHMLAALRVDGVIDVGANRGQYAVLLREFCGWKGPIYSFEPVRESFAALCRVMGGDSSWKGFNVALGSKPGGAVIQHFPASSVFDSFLPARSDALQRFGFLEESRGETVTVRRLDVVIGDVGQAAISWPPGTGPLEGSRLHLKIDTQGFDLEVLGGAEGCLDRVASLQLELSVRPIYEDMPTLPEAAGTVMNLGFQPVAFFPITGGPSFPGEREFLRPLEFDALFVRARHTLRRATSDQQ